LQQSAEALLPISWTRPIVINTYAVVAPVRSIDPQFTSALRASLTCLRPAGMPWSLGVSACRRPRRSTVNP